MHANGNGERLSDRPPVERFPDPQRSVMSGTGQQVGTFPATWPA
jgi:hypothetical protein